MPEADAFLFPEVHPARYGSGRRRQRLILPKFLEPAGRDMRLRDGVQAAAHQIMIRWADLDHGVAASMRRWARLRRVNRPMMRAHRA